MSGNVPWPPPPREPGAWVGGPPAAPRGGAGVATPPPVGVPAGSIAGLQGWIPDSGPSAGPQRPGSVLQDRAPMAVLLVSILVLAAVAIGAAYLAVSGRDRYPDAWDDRVEPLVAWVASERGLEFEHPVEVNFLTEAEYAAASKSEPATDEEEEAVADNAAEFRALGLISGDLDLTESVNTLSDSGTLAFYSPSTEEVYVRGETLDASLRVTLVHELVHVLQDQHFDLSRLEEMSSSRASVLRAIAEGDAGRIEEVYVADVLTDTERTAHEAESAASGDEAVESIRGEVPDALTALFTAPYVFGEPLVTYLFDTEGVAGIDEALRNPPTEEVLFNPHLWQADEADEVEVEVVIPPGTTEIRRDDVGPIAWYLVLAGRLDMQVALAAVDGLGGDEYVTFRDGQNVCVRATVVGDDEAETAELESALDQWVQAGPAELSSVVREGENLQFQACDPGPAGEGSNSLVLEVLALPATRTALYLEVRNAGASEAQAWCVASGVVRQFTLADFTNPDIANQRDLAGMMTPVMEGCVAAG